MDVSQTLQLVVAVVIDLATTIIAIATRRSCYIATKLSDTKCRTKRAWDSWSRRDRIQPNQFQAKWQNRA